MQFICNKVQDKNLKIYVFYFFKCFLYYMIIKIVNSSINSIISNFVTKIILVKTNFNTKCKISYREKEKERERTKLFVI